MRMRSIVVKMGISIFVSFFVLLIPLTYVFYQLFSNLFGDSVIEDLKAKGQHYSVLIANLHNENQVFEAGEELSQISKEGVRLIDNTGKIIFNSGMPLELQVSEVEEQRLLRGQSIQRLEFSPFYSLNGIWVGIPIQNSVTNVAAVLLYDNAKLLGYAKQKLKYVFLLTIVGAILMAIGLTTFLSNRLGQPLVEIAQLIRGMSGTKPKLLKKERIQGHDEIAYIYRAINDLSDELYRYYSTRNDFLANISHEIRTPLTYIQGYSIALKQGLYQDEKIKIEYLTIIEKESQRILKMVGDLINFSKIENGQFIIYKELCDVKGLITETIDNFTPMMNEKLLSLEMNLPTCDIHAVCDPERIKQVLFNLLDNAIRYTPQEGQLFIILKEREEWIEIRLKDTGIGIAQEELPLIWERFYRSEKSRDRLLGGVGLGLSIVKNLMELHHGTITVTSMLGVGTEFVLCLPKDSRDDKGSM
ncbi:MAG TPA: HAMP domain-containing sensor histidine kinase [Bacillota bacterium]|nr:HAMP domain-containing sensor histidine kinase [Bacillota bacterium]